MVYILSLLGALCYALASVLQQFAARQAPAERNMTFGLITYLLRRKVWLAGIAFDGLGYGLQAGALAFGPLALVEPLFVTGLLFALPLGAAIRHRRLTTLEWLGAVAVTGGLATFVNATEPKQGSYDIPAHEWLTFAAIVVAVAIAAWFVGQTGQGSWQAIAIGLATGVAFAFGTSLTKYLTDVYSDAGVHGVITNPALYALIVDGFLSMLMSQSAFQAGPLQSSLPALTVSEPVISSFVGVAVFHETINGGTVATSLAFVSAIVVILGIIALAQSDDGVSAAPPQPEIVNP